MKAKARGSESVLAHDTAKLIGVNPGGPRAQKRRAMPHGASSQCAGRGLPAQRKVPSTWNRKPSVMRFAICMLLAAKGCAGTPNSALLPHRGRDWNLQSRLAERRQEKTYITVMSHE